MKAITMKEMTKYLAATLVLFSLFGTSALAESVPTKSSSRSKKAAPAPSTYKLTLEFRGKSPDDALRILKEKLPSLEIKDVKISGIPTIIPLNIDGLSETAALQKLKDAFRKYSGCALVRKHRPGSPGFCSGEFNPKDLDSFNVPGGWKAQALAKKEITIMAHGLFARVENLTKERADEAVNTAKQINIETQDPFAIDVAAHIQK